MAKAPENGDSGDARARMRALAAFRFELRRYLAFAEAAAHAADLQPQQYQALLALKETPDDEPASVGLLAERLLIAPHAALGLVRRLEAAGLVRVQADAADRRRRLLKLTPRAERAVARVSAAHAEELRRHGLELMRALRALLPGRNQ